jgi:hypothetical protein
MLESKLVNAIVVGNRVLSRQITVEPEGKTFRLKPTANGRKKGTGRKRGSARAHEPIRKTRPARRVTSACNRRVRIQHKSEKRAARILVGSNV